MVQPHPAVVRGVVTPVERLIVPMVELKRGWHSNWKKNHGYNIKN